MVSPKSPSSPISVGRSSNNAGFRDLQEKAHLIHLALLEPKVDLWKLRALALSEGGLVNGMFATTPGRYVVLWRVSDCIGFVPSIALFASLTNISDALRQRAWPKLVGLHLFERDSTTGVMSTSTTSSVAMAGMAPSARASSSQSGRTMNQPSESSSDFHIDTTTMDNSRHQNNHNLSSSSDYHGLLVESLDVEQIERDVARCTWHLLTGSQRSRRNQMASKDKSKKVAALLKKKQRRLANCINLALVETYSISNNKNDLNLPQRPRHLRYYQGYHDVACIFLHALGGAGTNLPSATTTVAASTGALDPLGIKLACQVLARVSVSHLKDFCQDDFLRLTTTLHLTLYPLLYQLDPLVHNHLHDVDMEPFFCLSWILTWFSHSVRDTNLCKRLFDAFVSSHPLLVIYVALAMMLHPYNRQCILETDCDFAALHHTLTNLPQHSCRVGYEEDGSGYVTDHDEPERDQDSPVLDDDMTASTDMASVATHGILGGPTSTTSSTETDNSNTKCHVPFETLLDMALEYMARFPPRSVHGLAKRYYGPNHDRLNNGTTSTPTGVEHNKSCDESVLLQDAPVCCLRSTIPADWVLKQRLRHEMGLSGTNRKDRRRKHYPFLRQGALTREEEAALEAVLSSHENDYNDSDEPDYEYLKRHAADPAVIAAGFGPGPEVVVSLRRQRRRYGTAVAVGFVAMSVGLGLHYWFSKSTSSSTSHKATFVKLLFHPEARNASKMLLSTSAGPSVGLLETACQLPMACMIHHATVEREEKPLVPLEVHEFEVDLALHPLSANVNIVANEYVVSQCSDAENLELTIRASVDSEEGETLAIPPIPTVDVDEEKVCSSQGEEDIDTSTCFPLQNEEPFSAATAEEEEEMAETSVAFEEADPVEASMVEHMVNSFKEPPEQIEYFPLTGIAARSTKNTSKVRMISFGPTGGMVHRLASMVLAKALRSLEWFVGRGQIFWGKFQKLLK